MPQSRETEAENQAVINQLVLIGAFWSNGKTSERQGFMNLLNKFGRHERTRTADPFRVREVLYQLSYVPKG